ncbi:MAG: hypothetical protein IPM10_04175 [Chitinophagaceae bacterium]|nr:hypothetical protein [Chitinophagaceae bacterium]
MLHRELVHKYAPGLAVVTVIVPSVAPGQVVVFVVALPVGPVPSVTFILFTVKLQPIALFAVTEYVPVASAVKIPVVFVAPPLS